MFAILEIKAINQIYKLTSESPCGIYKEEITPLMQLNSVARLHLDQAR